MTDKKLVEVKSVLKLVVTSIYNSKQHTMSEFCQDDGVSFLQVKPLLKITAPQSNQQLNIKVYSPTGVVIKSIVGNTLPAAK